MAKFDAGFWNRYKCNFVRKSISVWLVSSLPVTVCIQTSKIGAQPYSGTCPNGECSVIGSSMLFVRLEQF